MERAIAATGRRAHAHGVVHILHGVDLEVPRRGDEAARRNGAGQDDDAAHDHGPVGRIVGRGGVRRQTIGGKSGQRTTPDIATAGLGYVPESMGIFGDLTVRENLLLAARGRAQRRRHRHDPPGVACSRCSRAQEVLDLSGRKPLGGQKTDDRDRAPR